MSKIGSIYVEIRGDYSKYKDDINALKAEAKKGGTEISDTLNTAISPKQASDGIYKLNKAFQDLALIAKTPADSFKVAAQAITDGMEDVRAKTGLTRDQFQKLNEQMLQTTAQKNAEKAFRDIGNAAGLSKKELEEYGKQAGFTSEQLTKMGISADDATKKIEPQTSLASRLTAGWAAFAAGAIAVYGAFKALKSFVDQAAEAEEVENRLAFALENVGYKWDETKGYVDAFAKSVQESTRFTDEDARRSLTTMTLYTDDLAKATHASALAMDLSVRSGMGLEEATQAVGMAMAGNMRGLARYIPEIRNLEKGMGDNMTATEKAEYALGLLEKRVGGSAAADINSYAGAVKNAEKSFYELQESLGKFLIPTLTETFRWLKSIIDKINEMVDPSLQTKYDEAVKAWTKIRTNIAAVEKEIREGGMFPGILQQQLAALNKQLAEQQAIIDKLLPQLKKAQDEVGNFKPITDKPLFDKNAVKEQDEVLKRLKKMEEDYYQNLGKSDLAHWETKAGNIKEYFEEYDRLLKWAADEFKKTGQAVTKEGLAEWDVTNTMFPEFKAEIDRMTKYGIDEWTDAQKELEAIAPWEIKVDPGPYISAINKEKVASTSLWKLSKSISDDIAKMNKNDYQQRLDLVEDEYNKRLEAAQGDADTIANLAEWKRLKQRDILEEQALDQGSFWDGVKVQYDRNLRDQITWGEQGAKIWQGTFGPGGALQGTLNSFFDDLFLGELKTAEDYFKSFTDAILKMFAKMIAEMVAQWAAAKLGDLILGTTTGAGAATKNPVTGSVVNTGINTGLSAGLNAGINYLAGTTGGAGGLASSLWSFASWGGPGSGLSSGAGAGGGAGAGVGGGALAGAGAAAIIAAAVIAYIKYGQANFGGTGYSANPFAEANKNLLINPAGGMPGVLMGTESLFADSINLDTLRERFRSQFGVEPYGNDYAGGNLPYLKEMQEWMFQQSEVIAAQKSYVDYIASHYTQSYGDNGFSLVPIDRHARTPAGDTTYAAHGALIDEPMVAYGRSGKRIVMGESGRERVVPEGGGQMLNINLNLDGRMVGSVLLDLSKRGTKIVHQRGITAN